MEGRRKESEVGWGWWNEGGS